MGLILKSSIYLPTTLLPYYLPGNYIITKRSAYWIETILILSKMEGFSSAPSYDIVTYYEQPTLQHEQHGSMAAW